MAHPVPERQGVKKPGNPLARDRLGGEGRKPEAAASACLTDACIFPPTAVRERKGVFLKGQQTSAGGQGDSGAYGLSADAPVTWPRKRFHLDSVTS